MSHYPHGGVNYEVPSYVSGSVAPTAPMVVQPSNQRYNHMHNNNNMDPSLPGANMDPNLSELMPQVQSTAYLSQAQEANFQLQLQAVAANEAAIASELHEGDQLDHSQTQTSGIIETSRTKRLGRACDACSKRKVKCGEDVPCKNCIDLAIPCTFSRPAKRRGPTNKVAESIKRQRTDDGVATAVESSSAQSGPPSIELIVPFDKVHSLVSAYFTYLYPIYPFPPEAFFLSRLSKREDRDANKPFLSLIISMIGLVACTFPMLIEQTLSEACPDSTSFVRQCIEYCLKLRAPVRESQDVDDAATAFFLALTARINGQERQFCGHAADSLSILRSLGVFQNDGIIEDAVTKDLTSRIFWAIYGAAR
jgi:hypothetical protein